MGGTPGITRDAGDYSDGDVDNSDDHSDEVDCDGSDSSGDNSGDDNNKKCDKRKDDDGDVSDIVNNSNKKSDGGYDPSTPCLNNFHFNTPILGKLMLQKLQMREIQNLYLPWQTPWQN